MPRKSTKSKINKSSEDDISKPSIRRLCRRAGIKLISGNVYDEVRTIIKALVDLITKKAVIYMEHARRKTVKASDVKIAYEMAMVEYLGMCGMKIYGGGSEKHKGTHAIQKKTKEGAASRKKRPGSLALQEIRKFQKSTDLLLQALPLKRIVRKAIQEATTVEDVRISKEAFNLLQIAIEGVCVGLLEKANYVAIQCKRVRVYAKDLQTVRYVISGRK